jgi:hypothetical protein
MKRAQLSVELIIILSALLVLVIAFMPLINQSSGYVIEQNRRMDTSTYTERLANSINTISLAGDGANTTLILPLSLQDNTDYSLNIYPRQHLIEIIWQQDTLQQHTSQITTSAVSGQLTGLKGKIRLRNTAGVVVINE